ncbi:MAG TPA: hypothetical protein VER12_01640 [Polyangiaceae bacterium]|nr:hypothetical protein [Polyangiaceae bacterium]
MSIAIAEIPSVLLLSCLLVTCAEQPADAAKTSNDAAAAATAETPEPSEHDAPAAVGAGESCADVACQSNSDCCKGYVCGFDPERSRVQRYCLGQ